MCYRKCSKSPPYLVKLCCLKVTNTNSKQWKDESKKNLTFWFCNWSMVHFETDMSILRGSHTLEGFSLLLSFSESHITLYIKDASLGSYLPTVRSVSVSCSDTSAPLQLQPRPWFVISGYAVCLMGRSCKLQPETKKLAFLPAQLTSREQHSLQIYQTKL